MSKIITTIPPLSPKGLRSGMRAHLSYGWDADFHAEFYGELRAEMQTHGFTEEWWKLRVNNLFGWRALRPMPKDKIIKIGTPLLDNLKQEYDRILAHKKNASIGSCDWENVEGLFNIAMEIKQTKSKSPAFASKLCHFTLPALFPIFDQESLDESRKILKFGNDYPKYWGICRDLWNECDCKQELKDILGTAVEKEGQSTVHYPWAAKITGLSLMNSKTS